MSLNISEKTRRFALKHDRALRAFCGLAGFVALVAMVRDTRYQGQDFEVFWRAGRAIREGLPLYDLARDGAMVFKYPPWIGALFVPFSLIDLEWAKWLWGLTQALSLVYVLRWTIQRSDSWIRVILAAFAFWGIWAVHALDGQISLPILALVLFSYGSDSAAAVSTSLLALSTKIFTGIAVLGLGKRLKNAKGWFFAAGTALLLSLPALVNDGGVGSLFNSWKSAATSGKDAFGWKVIGRDNQGIPALLIRLTGTENGSADLLFSVLSILVLGAVWIQSVRRKGLDATANLAGWLALAAICHPLAWFHSFVFVFPACGLALGRARKAIELAVGFLAVICVGLITEKTLGAVGFAAEQMSIKSIGALLAMGLVASQRPRSAGRA